MTTADWVANLFATIDSRDTQGFVRNLTDDAVFRFGNADPVHGAAAIGDAVGQFFEAIDGLQHNVLESWSLGDVVICHGTVAYTRRDGSSLSVPFADLFKLVDGRIREYLIFIDISALWRS